MTQWTCTSCHAGGDSSPPAYPDPSDDTKAADLYALLTTYAATNCDGKVLVVPGDPDNSGLVAALEGTCAQPKMPPMEFGPSAEDVAKVRQWVANGAPE
jgi:hypothetical protein